VPFTFENRVGRLIEASLESTLTAEEAQAFRTKMYLTLSRVPGRAVLLGDLRQCELFLPEVSERLITMLKTDTPKVERTAFLVREGPFSLQVERMVAAAARAAAVEGRPAPPRRSFREPERLIARDWLAEVLDDKERARLYEVFRLNSDPVSSTR
jgi:hypothetical protein